MSEKEDVIDRKGAWIERMFDRLFSAITQNPWATLLVLSVGLNLLQYQEAKDKDNAWRKDITSLNEKINQAVEKRVEFETTKQIAPIKAQQDSTSKKVDTSLININGTVESVKQYFNKKK
ncbi:MAG: hypothetical protein EOO20_03975 [Chryseobacterium sp.]|nr:MAG: hypothetical protein EOO20_03975 [Chryseobacterium sp.]